MEPNRWLENHNLNYYQYSLYEDFHIIILHIETLQFMLKTYFVKILRYNDILKCMPLHGPYSQPGITILTPKIRFLCGSVCIIKLQIVKI